LGWGKYLVGVEGEENGEGWLKGELDVNGMDDQRES